MSSGGSGAPEWDGDRDPDRDADWESDRDVAVPATLRPLAAAIATLADTDPEELGDEDLVVELAALTALGDRLRAQWLRRVAVLDSRGTGTANGALSSMGWLRSRLRLSGGAASAAVHLARELRNLPVTAAAHADGSINAEHAQVIARALDALRPHLEQAELADAERLLVEVAEHSGPTTCAVPPRRFGIPSRRPPLSVRSRVSARGATCGCATRSTTWSRSTGCSTQKRPNCY